ncbi:MAG: Fe-S-cluster containining protein [Oceanicoccus sp.]
MSDTVNIIETKDITPAIITADNKCDFCSALCCSYITQEIDTPRTMHAFDVLLWQVAHKGIHVFKDGNGWYLLSMTKCEFVMPDNRCGIYETRPMICREHSNNACEFDVPIDEGCDLYFQAFEELDNYCRKRFKTWDKRLEKFEAEQAKERAKTQ